MKAKKAKGIWFCNTCDKALRSQACPACRLSREDSAQMDVKKTVLDEVPRLLGLVAQKAKTS